MISSLHGTQINSSMSRTAAPAALPTTSASAPFHRDSFERNPASLSRFSGNRTESSAQDAISNGIDMLANLREATEQGFVDARHLSDTKKSLGEIQRVEQNRLLPDDFRKDAAEVRTRLSAQLVRAEAQLRGTESSAPAAQDDRKIERARLHLAKGTEALADLQSTLFETVQGRPIDLGALSRARGWAEVVETMGSDSGLREDLRAMAKHLESELLTLIESAAAPALQRESELRATELQRDLANRRMLARQKLTSVGA
ncbi:MAG: hypothetical protein HYV07_12515 [Deltaproteobacteria bacterium]|nr:hypothetical protein [Deltaproteobacteria bacterium]